MLEPTMTGQQSNGVQNNIDESVLIALLEVMDPEQILNMVRALGELERIGHGEVALVVKNGRMIYSVMRISKTYR